MIEGVGNFRKAAKQLASVTTIQQLLSNPTGAEKVRKAITEFTEATIKYVEQLETENAQLRAHAQPDEQPTFPPI